MILLIFIKCDDIIAQFSSKQQMLSANSEQTKELSTTSDVFGVTRPFRSKREGEHTDYLFCTTGT